MCAKQNFQKIVLYVRRGGCFDGDVDTATLTEKHGARNKADETIF